ncbi:MAG: patatin-like phospholipase family protein [Nitrospinae bacterium]|nr:patatin-like phospholipase family protein [Nitrospinota bacterium]
MIFENPFKVGLCLSGGAARGMTHLGVLREMEGAGLRPDMVAGASVGALIGALYALSLDIEEVERIVLAFLKGEDFSDLRGDILVRERAEDERRGIFRRMLRTFRKSLFYSVSMTQLSYLSVNRLESLLAKMVPDVNIEDSKIPFACVATDIVNSRPYFLTKGPLRRAIAATCSIPGFFPPIAWDGVRLVDGSWSMQNPVRLLREMGADFVVAIDISQDMLDAPDPGNGLEVVLRSNMATRITLSEMELKDADYVIRPDMRKMDWWDFKKSAAFIQKGRESAAAGIAELKKGIERARLKKFLTLKV